MLIVAIIVTTLVPGTDSLGDDHWPTREAASKRMRQWGLLAVPKLREGLRSESAEVRHRCNELLAPWRRLAWKLEAARVLTQPEMPDVMAYWLDDELRTNVTRLALKAG